MLGPSAQLLSAYSNMGIELARTATRLAACVNSIKYEYEYECEYVDLFPDDQVDTSKLQQPI